MNLAFYGHPFSSYIWTALIALYVNETAFELRTLDGAQAANEAFVTAASPQGKFRFWQTATRLCSTR